MNIEEIGIQCFGGHKFFLFKANMPSGKRRYIAKTYIGENETVLLDHWNLETLQKELYEIYPVMLMARSMQ